MEPREEGIMAANLVTCTQCLSSRLRGEFSIHKGTRNGLSPYCKSCVRGNSKKWYADNRDRQLASSRAWRKANPEKMKSYKKAWLKRNPEKKKEIAQRVRLKRIEKTKKYNAIYSRRKRGFTEESIAHLLLEQGNACAICRSVFINNRFSADHDHENGKPRGLLCALCNLALGKFKDNPAFLLSAVKYLTHYKEVHRGGDNC